MGVAIFLAILNGSATLHFLKYPGDIFTVVESGFQGQIK